MKMGNKVSSPKMDSPMVKKSAIFPAKDTKLAFRHKKYKEGRYMFSTVKSDRILYLPQADGTTVFDGIAKEINFLYHIDENLYDISYMQRSDPQAIKLYNIQCGEYTVTDFGGQKVDKVEKMLVSSYEKVRAELVKPVQLVVLPHTRFANRETTFPKPDEGEKLADYLKRLYDHFDMELEYDPKKPTIFVLPGKDSPFNSHQTRHAVNRYKGHTAKDFNFNLTGEYFHHETRSFDKIYENKALCAQAFCGEQNFDLRTGVYTGSSEVKPREMINEQPGIYFGHVSLSRDIPSLDEPFTWSDGFTPTGYGGIGVAYKVQDIVDNYRVNLKEDEDYGYGPEMTPFEYFRSGNLHGEAIARTSRVPLTMAAFLTVAFSYSEVRFIHEHFTENGMVKNFTMKDIIDLYKIERKDHWYIRKSDLLKVVDVYGENMLPPIIPKIPDWDRCDDEVIYNTEYDINSDDELFL